MVSTLDSKFDDLTRKGDSTEEKQKDSHLVQNRHTQNCEFSTGSQESNRIKNRKSKYDRALDGRYKLIRTIGTGNFAVVKLANHLITGKNVAIKIINKTELNTSSRRKLRREVRLMKVLNHPNIVRLLEIIDTEKIMYLVMEYASEGELYEYLARNGRMTESMAREKFRQILSAVHYCHQKRIIHRDLKTENLLLDANFNIKLADFGFANEYQEGIQLNTFCGSPPYAAPELFQGKEYNGPEVDIWSLGVILFKLVSGVLPFDGRSLSELRKKVLTGRYRIPFYMSTECERLLKKMLVLNPAKRHSTESLMKDRWVNIGYEENPLSPYIEPKPDVTDPSRISTMMNMGYSLDVIIKSLKQDNFDKITAIYYLLGTKDDKAEATSIQSTEIYLKENKSTTNAQSRQPNDLHSNCATTLNMIIDTTRKHKDSTPSPVSSAVSTSLMKDSETGSREVVERKVLTEPGGEVDKPEKIILITSDTHSTVRGNTNKSAKSPESYGFELRPNSKIKPSTSEHGEKGDRKNSTIHWYPTAIIAMRNERFPLSNGKVESDSWKTDDLVTSLKAKDNKGDGMKKSNDQLSGRTNEKPREKVLRTYTEVKFNEAKPEPLDPLELKFLGDFKSNFGRLDPTRQTVHCTNRPQLEQELYETNETLGFGENKTTNVAAARSNLTQLEPESYERFGSPLRNLGKPRGLFRSLTSRFSRRKQSALSPVPLDCSSTVSSVDRDSSVERVSTYYTIPPSILASVGKNTHAAGEKEDKFQTKERSINTKSRLDRRPMSVTSPTPENREKPRVLRFRWNMKITSKLPPEEMVTELTRVLDKNDFVYDHQNKFLFLCEANICNTDGYVKWEMEVCELSRKGEYGVRSQKISGTTSAFKNVMNIITQQIKL